MARYLIINGPNLNLLGERQPEIYGDTTLEELESLCRQWAQAAGHSADTFQSNHEGAIIDRIHDAAGRVDGIVINPGALTHYSYAIHDAIEAVAVPTIEVHISDIESREEWRRLSVVRPACIGAISGHGIKGYKAAMEMLAQAEESG
jgi:3-dehydroquinate dehydratase-2